MLQLPVDWVILDGRESFDDHGIIRYEWTLLQGAPSIAMKVNNVLHFKFKSTCMGTGIIEIDLLSFHSAVR